MKISKTLLLALGISMLSIIPTHAGWESLEDGGWKYKDDNTSQYFSDGWQWIDDDGDGIAHCYYFDVGGRLLTNTTTPDGYKVNENGEWKQNGVIKTKSLNASSDSGSVIVSGADEKSTEEKISNFLSTWNEYLAILANYIQENNHITLLNEMESAGYHMMIHQLPQESFVYMLDENTGIQIHSDYLYYGSIINGLAEGLGNMYKINETSQTLKYGYFIGEWRNNAPNGQGEEHMYTKKGYKIHNMGNYVDWYQDGDMTSIEYKDDTRKTFHYKVVDKLPVGIDTRINGKGNRCTVVAFPEENVSGYLTFYDSAQTVLHQSIDDGNRKNNFGYWGN